MPGLRSHGQAGHRVALTRSTAVAARCRTSSDDLGVSCNYPYVIPTIKHGSKIPDVAAELPEFLCRDLRARVSDRRHWSNFCASAGAVYVEWTHKSFAGECEFTRTTGETGIS